VTRPTTHDPAASDRHGASGVDIDAAIVGRPHYMVTFGALALGTLAFVLLQSMVLPALPAIQTSFHTSADGATWVLTAYLLSASVATPILGRMGDIHGKEKMLVIVMVALVSGTLLGALAGSLWVLLLARGIQGLAGAIFPLSFGIIRDEFPHERVPGGIGLISMLIGAGSGLGIILGGPVVEHLSVHWLFWLPLPATVLALVATIKFVPESPLRSPGEVNLAGAILLSAWLVTVLVAVSEGPSWGWGSGAVIALLATSALTFVAWVRSEMRSAHPLVDITMMRIPAVWWTNISALLIGVGMYAAIVVIPPFVQTPESNGYGFGASPATAGFYLAPQAVAMLIIGIFNGRITAWVGAKAALLGGCVLGAASFAFLAVAHDAPWEFFVAAGLSGVAFGLAFAAMSNVVVDAVDESQTGIATGMNANVRTIGGAIGSQVVASILASTTLAGGYPKEGAYALSFAVLAVAFLVAVATTAAIPTVVEPQLAT
jgi:EmrB/QacA subfamily drug resistance transporter